MTKKALFLDRDGTIIREKNYVSDPADVEILPGAPDALRRAAEMGYLLFLFTNQSGIGRGYYTIEDALKVNERMEELLGLPRPIFTEICMATESPEQPQVYRKPSPRFILDMIRKHGLDPHLCWMAGDANCDVMAGINAGIAPAALAGSARLDLDKLPEAARRTPIFNSLDEFVRFIGTGKRQ